MFEFWIQRHDYSSKDGGEVAIQDAIEVFEGYDWVHELSLVVDDDDERNCPPGIGFHNGFGGANPEARLLHVCPIDKESVFFNLHTPLRGKWLGIIPTKSSEIHYANPYPRRRVPLLIRQFYKGELATIVGAAGPD